MRRANSITFTLFVTPEEDLEQAKQQLLSLIPFSLEEERLVMVSSVAKGFNDRSITILSVRLEKERHTNAFLDHLSSSLSGAQKQQLLEQEDRLDDDCDYFVRFRKDDLPLLVLTQRGDCVHVRMSVAAFPKTRERALAVIRDIFSNE
jgi:RNA binding exosome subunit